MDELIPFGSREYGGLLLLLLFARGMDFLSTWIATPNMVLEGNPVAKRLGWKWGIPVNLCFCFGFALWPLPAVVISTTSVLVAARNFQNAWLMRTLGEEAYRAWHIERMQDTNVGLYVLCLLGQTLLTGGVGLAVIVTTNSAHHDQPMPMAIGLGIIAYAVAVLFYTLLGMVRLRRADKRDKAEKPVTQPASQLPTMPGKCI